MGKNQDPGSGINIPDPQHWLIATNFPPNFKKSKKCLICRFSGLTAEDLHGVRTRLRDVQAVLLMKFKASDILIGHSLESDLKALKV
jgi:hypothetical protein